MCSNETDNEEVLEEAADRLAYIIFEQLLEKNKSINNNKNNEERILQDS